MGRDRASWMLYFRHSSSSSLDILRLLMENLVGEFVNRERGLGLSLCVVRSLGTQSRGKIDAHYIYTFAYLYVCVFTIHSLSFVNIIVTITSLH